MGAHLERSESAPWKTSHKGAMDCTPSPSARCLPGTIEGWEGEEQKVEADSHHTARKVKPSHSRLDEAVALGPLVGKLWLFRPHHARLLCVSYK
mmetsp:Transcript_49457/g.122944  ORF Transcript_49457/g.122944 Transcript_49457/m.122944 type:complete len:94 (-) Transcript_49457:1326-1607(-)